MLNDDKLSNKTKSYGQNNPMDNRACPLPVAANSSCLQQNDHFSVYEAIPSQPQEGGAIVLDATKPLDVVYFEDAAARVGTAGDGEIRQVYSDASEGPSYGPQIDPNHSGLVYVDYMERVRYGFCVAVAGTYYRWQRVYLPRIGTWNHYEALNGAAVQECLLERTVNGPDGWFWWRTPYVYDLNAGVHTLELQNFAGGKRLQTILFTNDNNYQPEGNLEPSPSKRLDRGILSSKKVFPTTASTLRELTMTWDGRGRVPAVCGRIGNEAWQTLTVDVLDDNEITADLEKIDLATAKTTGLELKVTLIRDDSDAVPSVGLPRVIYQEDNTSNSMLRSGQAELCFDGNTGGIISARLNEDGKALRELMLPFGRAPGPRLFLKIPGAKGQWIDAEDATDWNVSFESQSVVCRYTWNRPDAGPIWVRTLTEASGDGCFHLTVDIWNRSNEDVLELTWPVIPEVCAGDDPAEDTLMLPRYEPQLINAPATQGYRSEVYPRGAMNWIDVSDGNAGISITALDPELILTELASIPDSSNRSVSLSITKRHRIRAGNGHWQYRYQLWVHPGDWHWAADRYREVFYGMFPPPQIPRWLVESNGFYAPYLASVERRLPHVQPLPYDACAHQLDRAWRLGVDHIQCWGQAVMDHACPTYYLPDPERGGEKAFIELIEQWREAGFHIGSYFHSGAFNPYYAQAETIRGVRRDDIPPEDQPLSWDQFVNWMDYGTEDASVPKRLTTEELAAVDRHDAVVPRQYPKMSGFSNGWRDYIRHWIRRYLTRYQHHVIYHDQLGNSPQHPEFNPHLGLHGEGCGGRQTYDFLRSLWQEHTPGCPDFAQFQEAVTDAYSVYAVPMTSGFHRNPEVFRYTFPQHPMSYGQANGGWVEDKLVSTIETAFFEGMKFDIIRVKPAVEEIVWLRDTLRFWVFNGIYRHNLGVVCEGESSSVEWRCFYTDLQQDQALLINYRNAAPGTRLQWDTSCYGSFDKAVFFAVDGNVVILEITNNTVTLPGGRLGAVLLVRKTAPERAIWFQARSVPDATAEKEQLDWTAVNISPTPQNLALRVTEHEGTFVWTASETLDVGAIRQGSVPVPMPHPRRLLIDANGHRLRRLVGEYKGTFFGHPGNRKNWGPDKTKK